jgi:hypothetical protein
MQRMLKLCPHAQYVLYVTGLYTGINVTLRPGRGPLVFPHAWVLKVGLRPVLWGILVLVTGTVNLTTGVRPRPILLSFDYVICDWTYTGSNQSELRKNDFIHSDSGVKNVATIAQIS